MTIPTPVSGGAEVAGDAVPCRECGYDLRGLAREGACPECGAGVEGSLLRHEAAREAGIVPLAHSSPRWVRRVAGGGTLVLVAATTSLIGTVEDLLPEGEQVWRTVATAVFGLGWVVVMVVGMWRLGTPEPGEAGGWRARVVRLVARVGGVIYVLLGVGVIAVLSGAGTIGLRSALIAMAAVTSIVTWAGMTYVAGLAGRIGRPGLRRAGLALAWLLPATSVARAVWLGGFAVTETHEYLLAPTPLFGELSYAVLVSYSLATWPRFGWDVAPWLVLATISLAAAAVVLAVTRGLWRVVRASERPGP